MKLAQLSNRALVSIDGDVAVEFLQNLITCDVENLNEGQASFGALLTPQGKILFDFFVVRTGQGFLFDIAEVLRADFIKRMMFYKLRTPVEIAANDDFKIFAAWNDEGKPDMDDVDIEDGYAFFDPRLAKMGIRMITSAQQTNSKARDYKTHRIVLGMPAGGKDYAYGDTFPHDAMMDQFESGGAGVAFTKGCYVGQEVVSRMQHRGTARRRIIMVSAEGALPETGSSIEADGKNIGTIKSHSQQNGLAMVRLDRLSKAIADGGQISCEGIQLTAQLPEWCNLSFSNKQAE